MQKSTQELTESIIQAVARDLAPDGYFFDAASKCFVKQDGDIRFLFQIAMAAEHERLTCTPDVGVRSERIEEVFHRTSEFSPTDALNTATLGVNLKLLTRSSKYDVVVSSAEDVHDAIQKLAQAFREVAIPYFSQFGSLKGIDAALNGRPSERCIHMINERARCSKGLIVAKLLHRPDYAELQQIYKERVARSGRITYERYFVPLMNDLDRSELS